MRPHPHPPSRAWRRAVPALLLVGGVSVSCVAAWAFDGDAAQRYGVLAGGLLALSSLLFQRMGGSFTARARVLKRRALRIEERRAQVQGELEVEARRIAQRDQELREALLVLYRAREYPEPVDLTRDAGGDLPGARLAELTDRDERVREEIEREGRALFERVKQNAYMQAGTLDLRQIGNDLLGFADRIARIYNPDAKRPLLETNLNAVLQAGSRACLHMLVVLDSLPLDATGYNLQSVYTFVRRGVRAYDTYKTASPYLDGVLHAGRLGRLALGANPIALGTSWVVSSLVSKGAAKLVGRYVDRQGLLFLHDIVRVIAHEVASLYGANFRHRDANWIFGVELVELAHALPLTRAGLRRATLELDGLRLRNEYDRVYLLRMLAQEKSAGPQRFEAASLLTARERRGVADRLSSFARRGNQHEGSPAAVQEWRSGLEERLAVRLPAETSEASTRTAEELRWSAVDSLASFLVAERGFEADEAAARLAGTRSARAIDATDLLPAIVARCQAATPFFEPPELSGAEVIEDYLADLVEAWLGVPPAERPTSDLILDVGALLGHPARETRRLLDEGARAALVARSKGPWSPARLPSSLALALVELLAADEELVRVYAEGRLLAPDPAPPTHCAIAVTDRRVFAFAVAPRPCVLWEGARGLEARVTKSGLSRSVELSGGERTGAAPAHDVPRVKVLQGRLRSKSSLAPLLDFARDPRRA